MMKKIFTPVTWKLLIILYIAATFAVSSFRGNALIPLGWIFGKDLTLHAIEFGILAWFLLNYLRSTGKLLPWWRSALLTIIFCAVVGGLNELWQYFIPGRFPSPSDAVANVVGAVLIVAVFRFMNRGYGTGRDDVTIES
ncbi:VanZ family protein [bacterium]|nr:VanZ family protein [bacterium]